LENPLTTRTQKKQGKNLLVDLGPLYPTPKVVPPMEKQITNESQRFWDGVTRAIKNKQYSLATNIKQELEENQRVKAKEREQKNEEWRPRFFAGVTTPPGRPELTEEGRQVLTMLDQGKYDIPESKVAG